MNQAGPNFNNFDSEALSQEPPIEDTVSLQDVKFESTEEIGPGKPESVIGDGSEVGLMKEEITSQRRKRLEELRKKYEVVPELSPEQRTARLDSAIDNYAQELADDGFPVLTGMTDLHKYDDPEVPDDKPRFVGGCVDMHAYDDVLGIGPKVIEKDEAFVKEKRDSFSDEDERQEIARLSRDGIRRPTARELAHDAEQITALEFHKFFGKNFSTLKASEYEKTRGINMFSVGESGDTLAAFNVGFEGNELEIGTKKKFDELHGINTKAKGVTVRYGFVPNNSKLANEQNKIIKGTAFNVPLFRITWLKKPLENLGNRFEVGDKKAIEEEAIDKIMTDLYVQIDDIRNAQLAHDKETGELPNISFNKRLDEFEKQLQAFKPRTKLKEYQAKVVKRQAQINASLGMTGKRGRPRKISLNPNKKHW